MPKINILLTLVLVICTSSSLQSQSPDFIQGRLLDSDNKEAVPFASIRIKNSRQGVVSNAQGDFILPNSLVNIKDTLVISCIGYITNYISVNTLKLNETNTIFLEISTTHLKNVEITAKKEKQLSSFKIVKKAIKQIPTNYCHSPFSYAAYYRDYQKKSDQYINLNEALMVINDEGFHTNDRKNSKIHLLEYKINNEFERDSTLEVNYDNTNKKYIPDARIDPSGGNELTMLMIHDPIRNYEYSTFSFMYKLKEDFLKNHYFKLSNTLNTEDESLYVITFKSINAVDGENYQAYGKLYIDTKSFAIHKLIYKLYKTDEKEESLIFNTQVEYSKYKDHMYLNYISFNNTFKIPNPNDFSINEILYDQVNNEIQVSFNNPFSHENLKKLSNYKIRIDNKKIEIQSIIPSPDENNKLRIILNKSKSNVPIIKRTDTNRVQVKITNLKDVNDRLLGERTYLEYQQFRELFVQDLGLENSNKQIQYLNKFLPLRRNTFNKSGYNQKYWMNTPLKN